MKVSLSVIKADIGGYVGHSESHPDIIALAAELLNKAKKDGLLIDCQATKCGDDLQLIMTHQKGTGSYEIHKLAWDTFVAGTELAKKMKLYGAGQDLIADAFVLFGESPASMDFLLEQKDRGEQPIRLEFARLYVFLLRPSPSLFPNWVPARYTVDHIPPYALAMPQGGFEIVDGRLRPLVKGGPLDAYDGWLLSDLIKELRARE